MRLIHWAGIVLSVMFFWGCQTSQLPENRPQKATVTSTRYAGKGRDGGPKSPMPFHYEKVRPVMQPFSHYGNPASYEVNGKRYQVLRSANHYRARGIASWYGTKFHKERTSSGDDYNMYGMTAAHRTLPLPSYLRVKNLRNGREVIVKVNDRGPFHPGRIVDLSWAAATKLGLMPRGTAPVEIEAIAVPGQKPAHYYVQAGAFSNVAMAKALQAQMTRLSHAPAKIEHYHGHYVVKVGPFNASKSSDALKMQLAQRGVAGALTVLQ